MRRRLVWIQAPQEGEGLFLLYTGPDGYYVVAGESAPVLVTPYSDGLSPGGIFDAGFTALSGSGWRFGAVGADSSFANANHNGLFYGPGGLVASFTTAALGISVGISFGSGLLLGARDQRQSDSISQSYWYTETASGNGPNTFPAISPRFALPGQTFGDNTGPIFQNADLTYAVRAGELLAADGTVTPILGGGPSPWPSRASFVGLTLFAIALDTPAVGNITLTPYRYNPDTGFATVGTPFSKTYADPGRGYKLRYVSYWTPTP